MNILIQLKLKPKTVQLKSHWTQPDLDLSIIRQELTSSVLTSRCSSIIIREGIRNNSLNKVRVVI